MMPTGKMIACVAATLAIAAPAVARSPTAAERGLVGRYYAGDELDHRLCAVTLSFESTVGGEVEATGCAARAPELDQATRWWVDAARGGPTFEDPVHRVTAEFADAEGGLIANTGKRTLTLAPVGRAFLTRPGDALPGRWELENEGGDDPTGGCAVRFGKDGAVTATPRCPASLRGAAGQARATAATVTLSRGGQRLVLAWGASADTLFLPSGTLRLVRAQ